MNTDKNPSGFFPVLAALSGNFFITFLKFAGFLISGSGAMFSESIHSLADSLNQTLIMIGIKRSTHKATEEFSYGYGQERFFWALISACGTFFIGAGVTIYHGLISLIKGESIEISSLIFLILGLSLIIETVTFALALREIKADNPEKKILEAIREGDPSVVAIVYEDGVAVLGVLVAFLSIVSTQLTGNHYWDSLGSIVIGILLGIVAIILINKNRGFLLQKSMPEEVRERAVEFLETNPMIEKVIDFKSTVLDIGKYRIKCEVEFNGPAMIKEIYPEGALKKEYAGIKTYDDFLYFCVDTIDRTPRVIGKQIDEIEKKLQGEIPEIKHIDIEIN